MFAERRRNRLAVWFETTRRPSWVLLGVILLLYGRSLDWGFVIDDARHQRLMSSFEANERHSLDLYGFLVGKEENAEARRHGWVPWWVGDDVRYQHWRPLSEWALYAQYAAFGERAFGYRAVSLALYAVGVCLVFSLFRAIGRDERTARWGALLFTVLASHTIPIVFISAQCDLWGLMLAAAAMLAAVRYVERGGWAWLVLGAAAYGLSLGCKEACLPMAVLPALFAFLRWERADARGRAFISAGTLTVVGLVWFAFYVAGGYGANTLAMLDPVHETGTYLAALPGRALVLLSSFVIPINPFAFYLRPRGEPLLYAYVVLGVALLLVMFIGLWRRDRGRRGAIVMALWTVPFLPLLVCTIPDDRIMALPSIGFAFCAALWLTRRRSYGVQRLKQMPFILFIALQSCVAIGVSEIMRFITEDARTTLEQAIAGFERPLASGDCVFFVNDTQDSRVLFTQLHFEDVTNRRDVSVRFLSDSECPDVKRIDERTLRISDDSDGLLTSFIGRMGRSHACPKAVGEMYDAGEFVARIVEMEGETVRTVELTFRRPLESDAYRFYWTKGLGAPKRWRPPQVAKALSPH